MRMTLDGCVFNFAWLVEPDQVYHVGQLVHALAAVVGVHVIVYILCAKVVALKEKR